MRPQDTFNGNAIIKITLPTQIKVGSNSRVVASTSSIVSATTAQVEVLFNRIIYIRSAFPSGLQSLETFFITLSSFSNPTTTQPTDPFEIRIFYEEKTNEISTY